MERDDTRIRLIYESLLTERDDVGRAYRQTKKSLQSDVHKKAPRIHKVAPKEMFRGYKQAQNAAKRLEETFRKMGLDGVPVQHVVFFDRAERVASATSAVPSLLHKLVRDKPNREISISVFSNWAEHSREHRDEDSSYLSPSYILRGVARHLHEWYPQDSHTSWDLIEKIAASVYQPKAVEKFHNYLFDEGIANLQDIRWESFEIRKPSDWDSKYFDAGTEVLRKAGLKEVPYREDKYAVEL